MSAPAFESRREKFYVGLGTSYHDPAIAVVDPEGEIVFAEASERAVGDKRAVGCAADLRETVGRIVTEHCDPHAEFVIAKSWSRRAAWTLDALALLGLADHERLPTRRCSPSRLLIDRFDVYASLWKQHTANKLSGGNLAEALARLGNRRVSYVGFSHHLTHAANGCYTSPFEHGACMVVDGQGEGGSISYYEYRDGRIRLLRRMRGPQSLGLLYSLCTGLCGFDAPKGEDWKMMGLAPYGSLDPEIHHSLRSLVRMNGLTFSYPPAREVRRWVRDMSRWARPAGADPMAAADLAHTAQHFYGEVMDELLRGFHAMGVSENLVLVGGCALNSSYNGRIVGRTGFERLHVPSAPADDGNALGAAFLAHRRDHPDAPPPARLATPYLGSTISRRSLDVLLSLGRVTRARRFAGHMHDEAARLLAEGKVVGWIQGRAEFGPRALGNRSILADARPADVRERVNAVVKFREAFRPLAPAILDAHGRDWFEDYQASPYMERALRWRACARSRVPGVVHVDETGRLQSVRPEWNARLHDLLCAFHARTGVPILLNTSFNVIGKPIAHSLEDVLGVFCTTGMDALVVEDYVLEK
jgi:carbamoyltransferase